MAQKTHILLIDDVDGSAADETVTFGLDGIMYEIDLTAARAAELRAAVAAFTPHARRVDARTTNRSARGRRGTGRDYVPADVRAWAASRNIDVPNRGRIPRTVIEQYLAAH